MPNPQKINVSLKFTHRGGKIEIGTIVSDISDTPGTCIFIRDNGIGINKETLEKLFKIDSKISRKGTEGELSTGLGLLLCKEYVDKHNGRIWTESEVGKGSTFFIKFENSIELK